VDGEGPGQVGTAFSRESAFEPWVCGPWRPAGAPLSGEYGAEWSSRFWSIERYLVFVLVA